MRRPRGKWAACAAATAMFALLLVAPGVGAQEPSATEHPIPTTPPGATATRPPGPWVDPPPAPEGCVPEVEPNDRPEQAGVTVLPPEFCVSGTLEVTSDQDLYFWEVAPEDGLTTWDVSVRGVPTTYTSVHIFPLRSAVGVTPIQRENRDPSRVDSDVWIGTPVATTGIRLPPGPYLLGISRALAGYKQDMTDDLAYWVELRRGASTLPPTGDSEPNDTVDTAIPVAGAFTLSGDAGDGRDMFRWQIPTDSDARAWRIGVEAAAGSSVDLYLRDTDGTTIATADAYYDPDGRAILHDLALAPGTYFIEIASNVRSEPYTLTTEVVVEPVDLEPNDEREQAVVIDPTTLTATGRLTSDRDVDRFVVDLDAAQVQGLVDVTLDWTDGAKRQLCLYTADDTQIACADSKDRITFPALMLAPGRTQLRVDGASGLDSLYTLTLASAGIPLGPLEVEPNDDIASANPVAGAFLVSGDLTGGSDFFAWTLSEADAAKRWHLDLSSTPGNVSRLEFLTADGSLLDELSTSRAGDGRMWDLQLAAGTWMIRVVPSSSDAVTYQLRAVESTDSDTDPEPNRRSPVPLDPAMLTATGRLASSYDIDTYSFDVTDAMAATLIQVDLSWPGEQERRLCIYGTFTQCASGIDAARLPSLDLVPGTYTLEVTGDASTASRYDLRVTAGPTRAPDAETEPNDDRRTADDWDPALQMHGTAREREVDVYRVRMPLDVPHRWRLSILGDGLELPQWSQPDGTLAGSPSVSDDGSGAVIDDLMLVSGDHFLEVRARGDYLLTLTDLGALDPLAETEPNDDAEHAGRLAWDVTRHGRLATPADADVYRFSLAAPEHVVITAVPDLTDGGSVAAGGVELIDESQPVRGPQGLVDIEVIASEMRVAHLPGPRDGPSVLDVILPPGDHEVWLRTATRGGLGYTITLERGDPFVEPGTAARPASDTTLTLHTDTPEVAAYIDAGQVVDAVLTIENTSAGESSLTLSAVTTDLRWTADVPETAIVPPAGSVDIPVHIAVPSDAWRDIPVRITIAARTATGALTTTSLDITPIQDAAPVSPVQVWPVPDALLGGLDVARVDLGGVPGGTVSYEDSIHDGYSMAGAGIRGELRDGSMELTIDLAGEDPIPVAGTIINATSPLGRLADRPRDIELWLSLDGTTYEQVLATEAAPVTTDQVFVLPEPVDARYARLVIRSVWASLDPAATHPSPALGEWKVVAAPGWAPVEPFDVAAAIHGGHIAWSAPDIAGEQMREFLDGTDTNVYAYDRFEPNERQDLVLGFRDDRAAQVTRIEWIEQPGTDPALRFSQAQVEVSTTSPFGPWRSLGTWDLTLAADGTVAPFELPEDTWARFVHLSIEPPADQERGYRTRPGQIRIIERATDERYRSILGEWGQGSPRGPFESLGATPLTDDVADDADDADGPDDPAQAEPVAQGQVLHGQVTRSADVDWYRITVPPDQNRLTLRLGSERTNGVRMTILDADGRPAAFEEGVDRVTGERVWTAYAKPGEVYRVGIEQPLLSVLIAFDTSGSVEPWWPQIRAAVRTFADDITPGQEVALVLPFAEEPLPGDWTDQPWLIQAALDARSSSAGSSCLRCGLDKAVSLLEQRDGARAILVLGDAVGGEMYGGLDETTIPEVDPSVFAVHFGAAGDEATSTAIMQDLSRSNGGSYQYATSVGDVDRAFDRMATWLRRPAPYTFGWDAVKLPPGSIRLDVAEGAEVRIGGVAVALMLDTSTSMNEKVGSQTRIAIAKQSLRQLVEDSLPEGLPVSLRVFKPGTKKRSSCATELRVPLGPLDKRAMLGLIDELAIKPKTRTPLAAAIEAAGGDIGDAEGPRIVVVVTDGNESCEGDPGAAVQALIDQGFDTTVNIVGLALDDQAVKDQMAEWAAIGGGIFVDAQDRESLSAGIGRALRAPFQVIDTDGVVVGSGIVGGDAVVLEPGHYRVEVLSEPPIVFEAVEVEPGHPTLLEAGGPEG